MASSTDLINKATYRFSTTTTAGIAASDTTIPLSSVTRLPTDTGILLTLDATDANGNATPTKTETVSGVIVGNNLTNVVRGIEGSAQSHNSGAVVVDYITAAHWNRMAQAFLTSHNQDGSLQSSAVQTALNLGNSNLNGWNPLGYTFTYGANNGNKEYTLTVPSDLTGTLSKGMKLQFTRGTVAPTQCMSFASASSQYATKASPSGITFTGAFTCEAWIYLQSYTGQVQQIINRANSAYTAGGWDFFVDTDGTIRIRYGSTTNYTSFKTYQSVPLNKWVHVAGVITSVASKTGQMYINGVAVATNNISTSSTTLTQTTDDLRLGAVGGGTLTNTYFNGYMSEVRVWGAAQSQANIQANMAISLTGSESNLVALFQGNGNFNDKTTNANNLTASGGAIATQAANPYNNVEYGILTNISYSNPNSTLTIFTGTDYNIPNMALSSPQYSTQRAPYGFPASRAKWAITFIDRNNETQSSPTNGTWYNIGSAQISIPTGEWRTEYNVNLNPSQSATTGVNAWATLSTANNSESDSTWSGFTENDGASATMASSQQTFKGGYLNNASQTLYYLNGKSTSVAGSISFRGDRAPTTIVAESAYI